MRFDRGRARARRAPNFQSMAIFAYHASHEQFAPSRLLEWTRAAEQAGFTGFFSSDHFHPWSEAQGQAGFSWAWVAAALASTSLPGAMIFLTSLCFSQLSDGLRGAFDVKLQ